MIILPCQVQFKNEARAKQNEEQERSRDHQRSKDPSLPGAFRRKLRPQLPSQALTMSARRGVKLPKRRERTMHTQGDSQQFVVIRRGFINTIRYRVKTI